MHNSLVLTLKDACTPSLGSQMDRWTGPHPSAWCPVAAHYQVVFQNQREALPAGKLYPQDNQARRLEGHHLPPLPTSCLTRIFLF